MMFFTKHLVSLYQLQTKWVISLSRGLILSLSAFITIALTMVLVEEHDTNTSGETILFAAVNMFVYIVMIFILATLWAPP